MSFRNRGTSKLIKTRKSKNDKDSSITRLSRKSSNTNKNIINNFRNKYILRIYSLNGFKIKVYDSEYLVIIKIGMEYEECSRLTIIKDDNPSKYYAELEIFNYQIGCNMTEDMERSIGTKIMMKTIIEFIKVKYPSINKLFLNDASMYKCDKLSTYKNHFSLYDYYLLKYGSTYYGKNFGAEMLYQSDIDSHEINKKLIKDYTINKKLLEKYLHKLVNKIPVPSIQEDIKAFIGAIYDNELATEFIKRYRFTNNTCYLMHFLFEFIKKVINISTPTIILENDVIDKESYQTIFPYCVINI